MLFDMHILCIYFLFTFHAVHTLVRLISIEELSFLLYQLNCRLSILRSFVLVFLIFFNTTYSNFFHVLFPPQSLVSVPLAALSCSNLRFILFLISALSLLSLCLSASVGVWKMLLLAHERQVLLHFTGSLFDTI